MNPQARAETELILAELGRTANAAASDESLAEFKARASKAFERDMQPICDALAGALRENDLAALKGLQALLPQLLAEVNKAPALADLLAIQLGQTFLEGLRQ
jgi:hypothetical protein